MQCVSSKLKQIIYTYNKNITDSTLQNIVLSLEKLL